MKNCKLFLFFVLCYAVSSCKQTAKKVDGNDSVIVFQKKIKKSPAYKSFKSFKGDTVAYMKYNFENDADYYLNKRMDVFFNAVELPIHNFVPGSWDEKTGKTDFLVFHFYSDKDEELRRRTQKNPLTLYVYFKEPVLYKELVKYSKRKTTDQLEPLWDDEAKKFLQKTKIKAISLPK